MWLSRCNFLITHAMSDYADRIDDTTDVVADLFQRLMETKYADR